MVTRPGVRVGRSARGGVVTALTAERVSEIWSRFVVYLSVGWGIDELADVTLDAVHGFVTAPIARDGELLDPSVATMHVRRCAVRLLFRSLRESGELVGDPTRDLVLPARSSCPGRPLSDDEVGLCRAVSLSSLSETRLPAAWALAEATARTSELVHIRVATSIAARAVSGSTARRRLSRGGGASVSGVYSRSRAASTCSEDQRTSGWSIRVVGRRARVMRRHATRSTRS